MTIIVKKPGTAVAGHKNQVKAIPVRAPVRGQVDTESIRHKLDYAAVTPKKQKEVRKWMGLPDPPLNAGTLASTALDREVVFGSLYTQEGMSGALRPPYEPDRLAELVETNNTLESCIDALITNVDGTGYEVIADEDAQVEVPDELSTALKRFFDQPWPGTTFMGLRKRIRRDLETTGNAYIEVIRNLEGKIALIRRMDPCITRIMRLGHDTFDEEIYSPILNTNITVQVRRRRYVQYVFGKLVYFREFGSPMHLNRFTGIWEDGRGSDLGGGGTTTTNPETGEVIPGVAVGDRATEVLHLVCLPHPVFPYGIPRWIHQIPSVIGSRRAEEWNLGFFEQGGIPPMLIVIQGGEAADNVEETIKNLFYSAGPQKTTAAILQVQNTSGDLNDPSAVKVTIERFGGDRQKDQMFQAYDKNCFDKVRRAFRIPPMFVGEMTQTNYATALASYRVAEAQVFAPERRDFDEMVTTTLLKDIVGDKFNSVVKFRSLPITAKDMEQQLKAIQMIIGTSGVPNAITPEELIDNVNEVTGLVLNAATPQERVQMAQEKALNANMFGQTQPNIEEGSGGQLEGGGGTATSGAGLEEQVGKREGRRIIVKRRPVVRRTVQTSARKFDIQDGEEEAGRLEEQDAERMAETIRKGRGNGSFDSVEFLSRSPEKRDRVGRKVARQLFVCKPGEDEAVGRAAEALLAALE